MIIVNSKYHSKNVYEKTNNKNIELAKAGVGNFVLIDFDRLELANVARHACGTGDLVSQFKQAREQNPAYVPDDEVKATVQVGLSSDILPISNMIVKLALVELSRGKDSGIKSLEEDLIADFYIWANRRDNTYENWPKMHYGSKTPSILRWYGARWERNLSCEVCGEPQGTENADDGFFG